MNQEDIFQVFEKTGALLSGHFQLRSGLHSDQFFQCALLLQYPNYAEQLCLELVQRMRSAVGPNWKVDGVIAPALGGIVVGHELARALGVRSIFAEKEEGRLTLRRNFEIRAGERFVVAEDVVTRGGRVNEVMDIVCGGGGVVAAISVLVDRSGGKASFGEVPFFRLLQLEPKTWDPSECPLCKLGIPLTRPGSK